MASDYDTPRRTDADDLSGDSLEGLAAGRKVAAAAIDIDESESAESFELPGADLSSEELWVRVIPRQSDEFTCSRCFLVYHRSRLGSQVGGAVCADCGS